MDMILKALKYRSGWSGEWSIVSGSSNNNFVEFGNINLIVGRNASGKTRLIEAIRWISDLLDAESNEKTAIDYSFDLIFEDGKNEVIYNVESDENGTITKENLCINKTPKLDRRKGILFYENLGQFLPFETDEKLLVINRRDNLQQPFFEILHHWGKYLSHYSFGGNMGKGQYKFTELQNNDKVNFKNFNKINTIYLKSLNDFGTSFEQFVIDDMERIDYYLSSISIETASKFLFIKVQEKDLNLYTYFDNMSQGMARAFSLIVQLNYSLMAKIPSCILIDDIGEGLDYDRSKKIIELIIEKVKNTNIQLFMTTNDRFVMNNVPLKYWSVIHREGNKSVFYNYQNSKQTFDDFALTGFNNFDFFTTEFYRLGFEEFLQTAQ